jgi:predicted hotdog family 3-hydroxylacyl-ACP dehydratase
VQVTRARLASLLPHADPMCLLEGVAEWSETSIRCVSGTHLDPRNPMRSGGCLAALCGIEYVAQAMAAHGALSGAVHGRPAAGYLASVRDLQCHAERLDTPGELVVEARRLASNDASAMYEFTLRVGDEAVLDGRATVLLDVSRVPSP